MNVGTLGDLRLRAVPGLVLQLEGAGLFVARASLSAPPLPGLDADAVALLSWAVEPATVTELCARLPMMDADDVDWLAQDLLAQGLLQLADMDSGHAGGFGHLGAHLPMVADLARVEAYAAAIARDAPGKAVAEIGAGTGILSLLAAQAGARVVHAVEETDIIEVARELFDNNGVKVALYRGNSREVELPERVDLLIHELFGVDPFEEGVISTLEEAAVRYLLPGGRLLPGAFSVEAAAVGGPAWGPPADLEGRLARVESRTGLDLGRLRLAARGPGRRAFSPPSPIPESALRAGPSALLRVEIGVTRLDLERTYTLPGGPGGEVSAVLLWFRADFGGGIALGTGPWDPHTHWGWQIWDLPQPIWLEPAQSLELRLSLRTTAGLEALCLIAAAPGPLPLG